MDQIVTLGEEKITLGKVLQLYLKDELPYLVIANHVKYHSDILAEFLRNRHIPFNEMRLGANKIGPPAIDEAGQYRLVGAGWIRCYKDGFELSENSTIYGLSPDLNHAKDISMITGKTVIIKKPEPKPLEIGYASILKQQTPLDEMC